MTDIEKTHRIYRIQFFNSLRRKMVTYKKILSYFSEGLRKSKTFLKWEFIKENLFSSLQVGVVFTIFHELFVDLLYQHKISVAHFLNYETVFRLFIVIVITSVIMSVLSLKNKQLEKSEKLKTKLLEVLNETGKMAKVGGWVFDIVTNTQIWTPGTYYIVELDLPKDKNEPLKRVNYYTPASNAILREAVRKVIFSGEPYDLELEIITAKGNHRWVRTVGKATKVNGKVVSIAGVIQDITDIKLANEALHESEKNYKMLSFIDGLTRLYNRRHFDEQLKMETDRMIRYGQPLTILFLDVDNFKNFNDSYGHGDGDKVLSLLGKILVKCLRTVDFAHRYGGEEFTVMLPSTNLKEGIIVAEKIRTQFSREIITTTSNEKVSMTISVGVAEYIQSESSESFLKRVDTRMYEAKTTGKNKVCF